MDCAAIIVGAGQSRRMGFDKLSADLNSLPVLQWSLQAFIDCKLFSEIVVVTTPDRFALLDLGEGIPVRQVNGGRERYLSVMEGLQSLQSTPEFVAIHDGARPLIISSQIAACLQEARQHEAAALARRVTETLKTATTQQYTRESVSRDNLWFMETPQVFRTSTLHRAYENVLRKGLEVTDEVSALESLGMPTKLVESTLPNPKITVEGDLAVASAILNERQSVSSPPN